MKAVMFSEFGDESVLSVRELPEPVPAPGQVKVRVRVASLNPIDFKLRSGILRFLGRPKRPAITGKDFAGEITALGDGVLGYSVGQRVFGSIDPMGGLGSCTESLVISTDLIAPTPASVPDEVVAALPVASGSALQGLLDIAALKQGQSVLITGASGAVGATAVQLARSVGAHIVGVCGTSNVDYVRSLGADRVIDYKLERWQDVEGLYDVVFDAAGVGTYAEARVHLKAGGIYLNTMPRPALFVASLWAKLVYGQRCIPFMLKTDSSLLQRLANYAEQRVIVPHIDATVGLDGVAGAQRRMAEGRVHGKICVRMDA